MFPLLPLLSFADRLDLHLRRQTLLFSFVLTQTTLNTGIIVNYCSCLSFFSFCIDHFTDCLFEFIVNIGSDAEQGGGGTLQTLKNLGTRRSFHTHSDFLTPHGVDGDGRGRSCCPSTLF